MATLRRIESNDLAALMQEAAKYSDWYDALPEEETTSRTGAGQ